MNTTTNSDSYKNAELSAFPRLRMKCQVCGYRNWPQAFVNEICPNCGSSSATEGGMLVFETTVAGKTNHWFDTCGFQPPFNNGYRPFVLVVNSDNRTLSLGRIDAEGNFRMQLSNGADSAAWNWKSIASILVVEDNGFQPQTLVQF